MQAPVYRRRLAAVTLAGLVAGGAAALAGAALQIARRARHIAVESVLAGMGLSFAAMLVAAAGYGAYRL